MMGSFLFYVMKLEALLMARDVERRLRNAGGPPASPEAITFAAEAARQAETEAEDAFRRAVAEASAHNAATEERLAAGEGM